MIDPANIAGAYVIPRSWIRGNSFRAANERARESASGAASAHAAQRRTHTSRSVVTCAPRFRSCPWRRSLSALLL